MPNVVMVIAQDVFRDEEYAEPRKVLEQLGARVTTASIAPGKCTGKLGMCAEAEMSLAEAAQATWNAALFVGGGGATVFFDDPNAHLLAHRTYDRGAIVGAICIAPSVLAHAGLLDGIAATAFPSQQDDLVAHGALWSDEPVVTQGRIVTANGPDAASSFGLAVADLLGLAGEHAEDA